MRVVHEPAGGDEQRVLATDVEVADSTLAQAKGLMFRESVPEDFALVMDFQKGLLFGGPSWQTVHMLFVPEPIDVVWLVDDEIGKTARLSPWTGVGVAKANRIIEFPAGGVDGVAVGDVVRTVED
jgi:uncharacterized membrane protein (UPF0127 family)